jgi:hypothetical protein
LVARTRRFAKRARIEFPAGEGRYVPRNENFDLVRSQKHEARISVALKAARECKHCANPFWLLASGFSYPAAFWRDIKGAALG